MNNVNKTLYIPLFSKAFVSKKGLFLDDKYAEKIWDTEGFALKGRARSKWLSYYLGMRARVFDDWVRRTALDMTSATVIHIGCGLDSRALRLSEVDNLWYDVDFPEVIAERKKYYENGDGYRMLEGDAREGEWLDAISEKDAIVVMEGVAMYLAPEELGALFERLAAKFNNIRLLMDAYSVMAAKLSKYKNPVGEVGVSKVYGINVICEIYPHGFHVFNA